MNKCSTLAICVLIYSYFTIILFIDINNVTAKESLFVKFIDKLTLRPLKIFSSVDFILDKSCKIYPEKYFKSPNIILNCGLKEDEYVTITFNRMDKGVDVYQNDNRIGEIYIKLDENAKVDICTDEYDVKNNAAKACRSIVFWVINEYEAFHKDFVGYDEVNFNDNHLLDFIDGSNGNDSDIVPFSDMDSASIHCVILEKKLDGKSSKILLSPIDGVIKVNIKFGSKLILHLPQYQRRCSNILEEINHNSKNPSIIYFIDSKRLGFGPLSIDISSPELINVGKDVEGKLHSYLETMRSFFLSTLNKNSNKRGFVLFIFNYSENKLLDNDCLEMLVDDTVAKGIVTEQKDFKLPSNVFKCFYNEKYTDTNVKNVSIDIINSDGMMLYVMKLIDKNNMFLYLNGRLYYYLDKLQENGFYQHQIFLNPGQKKSVKYIVKNREGLVLSKIELTFSRYIHIAFRDMCHRYVHHLSVLIKYLTFSAILIDLKGVMDLWLFNKLVSSIKGIFGSILDIPNEFSLISGHNNIIKKYEIVPKLFSLITIGKTHIYTDKNNSFEESYINYIYDSLYAFISAIIVNLITLLLLFIVKIIKINKRYNKYCYTKITEALVSIIPYTLIFTLSNSLNIISMTKFNILVNEVFISHNILKVFSVLCIITSLLIYKMVSHFNRNIMDGIFTYSPWKDCNYVLKSPEFPYFKTIQWPLQTIGETNIIKIGKGKNYFLIEYKLDIPHRKGIDSDLYHLSIISATFNKFNDPNLSIQMNEERMSILNTPAAWIKTNMPGTKTVHNNELITNISLSDLFILSIRGYNEKFYIHHSQTLSNKSTCSISYVFTAVLLISYSNLAPDMYFKNSKIVVYIICVIVLKLNDFRRSKNHKFQNEWFKFNVYRSSLVDLSSYGILIGLCILKILISVNIDPKTNLMKGLSIMSSLIMFSSIIPSIVMVCIWATNMIVYYSKVCNNIVNLSLSYIKINISLPKTAKKIIDSESGLERNNIDNVLDYNENGFESAHTDQLACYIENNNSESSLIYNAIFNAAKPVVELDVLRFTFLYNNIPISLNACYIPLKQYKKLLYYFGELCDLPKGIEIINNSNLTICPAEEFNVDADLTNFFATIEISRPLQISNSLPNIHNNCLSLDIKPPGIPREEGNKLYDVNYDDTNHMLIITGPFITPSGIYILRASIKNECKNDSDANFITSMIADNCKCHYHGILHVPINPEYITYLSIYNKIHIYRYSAGKSISFTINPKSTYVEINTVSNHMVLRNQNFVQGYVYKVQYKCLPNKTNLGFMETVIADENISKIEIPILIPKENFNYRLYEYHVTNSIDITCSITPMQEIWGFHDEFILKIINSYPKVWGLSNILDYKIPCAVNRSLEDGFYRITPKYNIAASIAEAQREELMALYSALILNRINSLEFTGFYFYDKEEINDFFNSFGITLQLKDIWINPMSDCAIKMYGHEKMQKAYNALYLDLKCKLELYINLSERIVSHLWDMKSLYDKDIILEAIDTFDKLTLNNTCVDSAIELAIKRVSRDIPQDSIKKLLFPPIISGEYIKWNIHLSNQLDEWKSEIKSFFDIKIGVLNSFSMLTSSYAITLDFTLSCLGNSLRRLSNEFNLLYILNESNVRYKLTHIVITEKSLISRKNDWNIPSNYMHTTSFNALMGYVKIKYPYDSLDTWYPAFLNWKPHGIIFDVINVDQVYVKFTDISSLEIDCDFDDCENEPSVFNGLFDSEKMKILSLTCKNNSFKTIDIESSDKENVCAMKGFVYQTVDNYKLYFKTTYSNSRCLELIFDEYTRNSKIENDNLIIMEVKDNKKGLNNIKKDEIGSIKGYIQESHNGSLIDIIDKGESIESELGPNESVSEISVYN